LLIESIKKLVSELILISSLSSIDIVSSIIRFKNELILVNELIIEHMNWNIPSHH